jgi:microcystin-dependent protein
MALEVSTFISGLTAAWPTTTDLKSQGDDHLRLIKSVLQSTFPNASKALYFPVATVGTAAVVLAASDMNRIVMLGTASGDLTVSLPTLAAGDAGWSCEIMKTSIDTNGIMVSPASGTISSKSGVTATIRVGVVGEPARFVWSGSTWFCMKPGPMIGATVNFDGPGLPPGHLTLDGSVYNSTTFAELFAMLGTATLRDKRGRLEAGVDGGAGRLGSIIGTTNGSVGGSETIALTASQLPGHTHSGATGNENQNHNHNYNTPTSYITQATVVGGASAFFWTGGPTTTATPVENQAHNHNFTTDGGAGLAGVAHSNLPPTIVTQKIIRAC